MKIGDTIWIFDTNCRVYVSADGRSSGSPIYRKYWHETKITGESARSWITAYGKVPKRGPHPKWAFTAAEVDDDCWMRDHRYKITRMVESCDLPALRKVAEIVGYKETE